MVQAIINISKRANQVLNIVKARHGLRTKSEAISKVVEDYGENILEPPLRPEFVRKLKRLDRQKPIHIGTVADLRKRYE